PASPVLARISPTTCRVPYPQSAAATTPGPQTPCPSACKDGRVRSRNLHSTRYLSPHPGRGGTPCKDGRVIAEMSCDSNHLAALAKEDVIDRLAPGRYHHGLGGGS